jgi:hypothetical protein
MLKIGEFSRLSQVTVKTLHHYDDLGLIKPAVMGLSWLAEWPAAAVPGEPT